MQGQTVNDSMQAHPASIAYARQTLLTRTKRPVLARIDRLPLTGVMAYTNQVHRASSAASVGNLMQRGELAPVVEKARHLARLGTLLYGLMPAGLAARCRVANLEEGKLHVLASSNATAAKLRQLAPRLSDALSKAEGRELTLRFSVQPESGQGTPEPAHARLLDPNAAAQLDALAARLPEGSLRRAVLRLAQKRGG